MQNNKEKEGYKYTEEFGYIPNDWDVEKFKELFVRYSTNSFTRDEMNEISGTIKNVHYGDILVKYGSILDCSITNVPFLNITPKKQYKKLNNGDIVIADTAEDETVGKCVELSNIRENDTMLAGMHTIHYRPVRNFAPGFLGYFLNSDTFHNQLLQYMTGIKVSSISKADINKTSILIPSIPEQEKIAEVLSDVDDLINSTQKLIDKKKDLKTATMQKLLTPKDNWKTNTLEELNIDMLKGNGLAKEDFYIDGKYECIHYGELFTQYKELIKKINNRTNIITVTSQVNDVLMPTSDVTPTGLAKASCINKEGVMLGGDILVIRCSNKINGVFLSYCIRRDKIQIQKLVSGTTVYHIYPSDMKKFKLSYPKSLKEQQNIVNLLLDMDLEIEALEKELVKYKDLKSGMMQQLLTGKIRLKDTKVKDKDVKVVPIDKAKVQPKANDEFKDAVLISMLAYKFGSNQYPLGAFRRQKLSYLFKRHNNLPIDEYLKKAMGPYNSQMKYRGGEGIAIRNKYVKQIGSRGLVATGSISKAEDYFNKYYGLESLSWLETNFKYTKNDDLEVIATVDYAIVDLKSQNKEITLDNIKSYIENNEEWKPKLQKDFFNDNAILKAMNTSRTLLKSY